MKKILRFIRQKMHEDVFAHMDSINQSILEKMDEQVDVLNNNGRLLWADAAQSINQ